MASRAPQLLVAVTLLLGLSTPAAASTYTRADVAAPAPAPAASASVDDAAASDDDADLSAEEELAARYAPVMKLVEQSESCGTGEPYTPSDVDPLFDEDSVALRGPWTDRDLVAVAPSVDLLAEGLQDYALDLPGDPLKPGCDYEKWAKRVWGPDPTPTIYAHVATQAGVTDRIALQFYFYYPFNDFNNKHESDWERIQVEFPAPDARAALDVEPDRVLYAQHYGAEAADWDDAKLTIERGTHPVVYVSAGSHASQFGDGVYLGRSSKEGFGCDTTVGPHVSVSPRVKTISSDPEQAAADFPWTSYRGHWGELGPQRFYRGPTGPNMKQAWTKPFTWSAHARDNSFSLPGAEAAGNDVSEYFCTMVATGSDVFRTFSADPVPTLLGLLVALLGLGWLLRRTGWHQARALPLVAVRRPGEVVAAAVLMLRRRRRAFLLIAAPAAACSIASSVISARAPASSPVWTVLSAIVFVALVLSLAWAQLATAQAVVDFDAGRRVTLGSLIRATRTRVPTLLATLAIWVIVVGPLLLTGLLAPVALAFVVAWSLALPVVQVEGRSGWSALRRSWRLVQPQLVVVLVVLGLSALLVSVLGGLLAALAFVVSSAPFTLVSMIPQLVTALVWPVTALLTTYAWANGLAHERSIPSGETEPPLTRAEPTGSA